MAINDKIKAVKNFFMKSVFYTKLVNTLTTICLTRFQNSRWPMRLVRSIRIMLCFQTYSSTLRIYNAILTLNRSVQEITGINLNTRFIGINFHGYSCKRT